MSFHRAAPAVLAALLWAVQPQSAQLQSAQPQSGTATITGTVVALSSGEPIGDATASLFASTLAGNRISTTTDSEGRFQFANLAAGRYTVGAAKKGFVNVTFGERHYARGGRAIPLHDAEHRDLRIQLPHTNVITGRIAYEGGNPAPGASVEALQFTMVYGYRRARAIQSADTDSNGIFRIESLTPGDYAICASTHQTAPLNDSQRLRAEIDRQRRGVAYVLGSKGIEEQKALAPRLAELEARLPLYVPAVRGYAPVCYPGSRSPEEPTITLAPDEERSGVDMQFALSRLARIEGIVKGMPADNQYLDPIMMLKSDDIRLVAPDEATRPDLEGRFAFTNVPSGRYQLYLRSSARSSLRSQIAAAAEVFVADQDISNVVLDLQSGMMVSGKVVFRGTLPAPSADSMARAGLEIRLDPADPGPVNRYPRSSRAFADATGQFVLRDVFPGKYRITALQKEPSEWIFDPTTTPGADVTGRLIEVKKQDITGVTLTLTELPRAEISGTIMTDKGEPAPEYVILLYPVEEKYRTPYSLRMYATRANQDGVFAIRGQLPGDYRLATLLDAEWGAWFDPAYLHRIDADSIPVSIASDEKKVLSLRVPGDR